MKRFCFLSVAACFVAGSVFMGCNKDDDGPGNSSFTTIDAKVEKGTTYSIDDAVAVMNDLENESAEVVAEAKYVAGGFKMKMPATVDPKFLESIGTDAPKGIVISDKTAKIGNAELVAFKSPDFKDAFSYMKASVKSNDTGTSIDFSIAMALIVYADKKVTMKGTFEDLTDYEELEDLFSEFGAKFVATANVGLNPGWNYMFVTMNLSVKVNLLTQTVTGAGSVSLTSKNPGGLKWYYGDEGWNEFNNFGKTKNFQKAFSKINDFSKLK